MSDFDFNTFDPNEEPEVSFDAIPVGKYLAVIVDNETKENKSGTGSYENLKFEIIDGEYKGRLVWTMLNLNHSSMKTVAFARAELGSICKAIGIHPKSFGELHNQPMCITVGQYEYNGETKNEIKKYEPKENIGAPAQSAGGNDPMPWKKK